MTLIIVEASNYDCLWDWWSTCQLGYTKQLPVTLGFNILSLFYQNGDQNQCKTIVREFLGFNLNHVGNEYQRKHDFL
jgi:hypothetical protein